MTKEQFIEELTKLSINLTDLQLAQLDQLYDLLIEWNSHINLTTIVLKEEVYLKHFYDSLTLIKAFDFNHYKNQTIKLCDIGTGAGFPGLVLKIVFPNLQITLVDSLQKRINYLNVVIDSLELSGIVAEHNRGEDFAKNNREKFDIVTVRAMASLRIISEICLPIVKVGGYFIPMKANISSELEEVEASKTISKLSGEIEELISFNLPFENSIRNLVKIKKVKIGLKQYPRSIDKIKKIAL